MATAIHSSSAQNIAQPMSPPNDAILKLVADTENIEKVAPKAILAVLVGVPVVLSMLSGHPVAAAINGLIMFLIAGLIIRLVNRFVLRPMRTNRYTEAAATLASQMKSLPQPASLWRSWFTFAPGTLALTRSGKLVIADRSTDYTHLWLSPEQIVNVSVEREATQFTNTKHSGTYTFGGVSQGVFGAFTTGGRSKSVTTTIETAFLEIRYQLERNGSVYTSVVPFGTDRRGADEVAIAIKRLEALA